ncbi:MAG: DNA repair protein RecN (Recombination protein N) [Cryomorphaceae bacterium]|jgi:DNA repair protein RecN (Recombination protein N)
MALVELNIRNFAIIKQLEIEVDDGLTVVTGETGAGKSIVLDALNLLLGSRAESEMVRHGEDQCEITALFSIKGLTDVQAWLDMRDLVVDPDSVDYCLIRRIVRVNKPTKCYINDQPSTLASLKELGLMLVDLHGQHEHQSLLRKPNQRRIIDQFAGHHEQLTTMAKLAAQIHRVERELSAITQGQSDNADRMELMSFQLNELNEANILDGEFEQLELEHARLSNAQGLTGGIETAVDALFHNESSNVTSELGKNINQISELLGFDPNLKPANDLLNSALAQIEEAQSSLESALSKIEDDPERLSEAEQRRDTLINLARKHRCKENELPARHQTLQAEYQRLESEHSQPELLEKQLGELTFKYHKIANSISAKRQEVASQLSELITAQMQDLGMKGGYLEIQVEAQISDDILVSEHGIDHIEFMVSTNYGMPLKAMHKTASGGELSRISLAIQVITSEKSDTPTLVFDEVDVGVGGKIAQIVGERLKNLGNNAQVICITHLPQVAAQGTQHIFIDKVSNDTETYSTMVKLSGEMRTTEIARMLGGAEITDRTRAHAQEMLAASLQSG